MSSVKGLELVSGAKKGVEKSVPLMQGVPLEVKKGSSLDWFDHRSVLSEGVWFDHMWRPSMFPVRVNSRLCGRLCF